MTPNEILPRGSSRYNEFMTSAVEVMTGGSTEPIDREAEMARENPIDDEERERRAMVQQVIQGIAIAGNMETNPILMQRTAANQFSEVMTRLTGKTFRIELALRFTRHRSYETMHMLTNQAIKVQEMVREMTRTHADSAECLNSLIGHKWPEQGGDSMLMRVLYSLTRDTERADQQITNILLKAMTDVQVRPPKRCVTPPSGVVIVSLSGSSGDEEAQ